MVGDFALTSNVHYATVPLTGPIGQEVEDLAKIHDPSWVPEDEPFPDCMNGHLLKESQLLHFAEALHALKPRPAIMQLMHQLANVLGIDTGTKQSQSSTKPRKSSSPTRYVTVHHRSNFAMKSERPGVSPEHTIRSMRLARHAYGGTRVAFLESDDPNMIDTFRRLEPSITWLQLPRCLFAASQGKGHVMDTIRKQEAEHPTIMMNSTTN